MGERDFYIECDLVFKRSLESPLSLSEYDAFIKSREWKFEICVIRQYLIDRGHLEAYDPIGSITPEGKIFSLSNSYTSEYDKKYNSTRNKEILEEHGVEDISKKLWYRKSTLVWTILLALAAIIISLWPLLCNR